MGNRLKPHLFLLVDAVLLGVMGCGGAIGTSSISIAHSEWTWVSGSNEVNEPGTYETEGTSSVGHTPGARFYANSWTDSSGNLWLFGGYGFASAVEIEGDLNDLWKYTDGKWIWVSGSKGTEQAGSYGTLGVPAATNYPGARHQSASWTIPANVYELSLSYLAQKHLTPRLSAFADVGAGMLAFLPLHSGAYTIADPPNRALAPNVTYRPLGVGGVGLDYILSTQLTLRAEYRGQLYKFADYGNALPRYLTVTSEPTVSLVYNFHTRKP